MADRKWPVERPLASYFKKGELYVLGNVKSPEESRLIYQTSLGGRLPLTGDAKAINKVFARELSDPVLAEMFLKKELTTFLSYGNAPHDAECVDARLAAAGVSPVPPALATDAEPALSEKRARWLTSKLRSYTTSERLRVSGNEWRWTVNYRTIEGAIRNLDVRGTVRPLQVSTLKWTELEPAGTFPLLLVSG